LKLSKSTKKIFRIVGVVGTIACAAIFIWRPSFPTPDKILIFLTFVFMAYSQAIPMLKRLLPFVAILLVYESFRSIADHLNTHVNYTFLPHADKFLFGNLPVYWLQSHLWRGHTSWYDFVFYTPYLLHFVLPILLALLIWKKRPGYYWRFVSTFLVVSYMGFVTFLLFPSAPPWMASNAHVIEPIHRISSNVWFSLGLSDFPSFYSRISPNPVAAMPSLHAAWSTLFCLFIFMLFGRKWGALSLAYPLLIYSGTVYQGEHYAIDIMAGIFYALAAYWVTPQLLSWGREAWGKLAKKFKLKSTSNTKSVAK
jgi:hypothetical protein